MSLTEAPSLAGPSLSGPTLAAPAEPARARSGGPVFVWEAAKTLVAVLTFTAMFLPLAFPSKAGTQARLAQTPAIQPPAVETQPLAVAAKPPTQPAKAAAPVRNSVVPQPAKKPTPKNT
ncbi:hypothetical protein [Azospirillum rugosum]|uniref:Uncharacterized protein n=1 Tax=Azospirillum rugosum TaxID=416170 RepID=A0ABS4SSF8_9PROT|nr:hypothetical protein [Azospirillum rugosum]MBP2294325.1 hypothetical protein [Azospirillum rugosum]MDQ0527660.1 hypothetical protein [Azospirillum rugosum]